MKQRIKAAVIISGFGGFAAQMLLLRELLIVFSGNELTIGIILANWLLLESFGAFASGKFAVSSKNIHHFCAITNILLSLFLFTAIFATRNLRIFLGYAIGQRIGLAPVFISSFFLLLPVSILHGAMFPLFNQVSKQEKKAGNSVQNPGTIYIYETFGTLLAGIAWTFFLVPFFTSMTIAGFLLTLHLLVACIFVTKYTWAFRSLCLATVLSVTLFFTGVYGFLHTYSISQQWSPHTLVHYSNSRYANWAVLGRQDGYTFFIDGQEYLSTPVPDIAFVEEFTHLPMLIHNDPEQVLVLGGGAGGVLNELLKHPYLERIDYAELDPTLFQLLQTFHSNLTEKELTNPKVSIHHTDGRYFLQKSKNPYDIIYIGIKDVLDLQSNRFFTHEFFSLAAETLSEQGLLVLPVRGSFVHTNGPLQELNSLLYHTAKQNFSYVRVFPGDSTNIFIAANTQDIMNFTLQDFGERIVNRQLMTRISVPRHLQQKLHTGWLQWFPDFIEGISEKYNHDFFPKALLFGLSHWALGLDPYLSRLFSFIAVIDGQFFFTSLIIFLLAYLLFRIKLQKTCGFDIPFSIASSGFAGMCFDLILIFSFQALYGYLIGRIGLIISVYMTGAMAGAFCMNKNLEKLKNPAKTFLLFDIVVTLYCFLLPTLLLLMQRLHSNSLILLFYFGFAFLSGFVVSIQFPLAVKLQLDTRQDLSFTAGSLYAADLIGAWLAALIVVFIFMPAFGLIGACITTGLIKLFSNSSLISASIKAYN